MNNNALSQHQKALAANKQGKNICISYTLKEDAFNAFYYKGVENGKYFYRLDIYKNNCFFAQNEGVSALKACKTLKSLSIPYTIKQGKKIFNH